jgi:hypothetical protein
MLPATERPKSARSFTNQFLKERKRKRDLFLFGMNRNESPSQRNKCDNTTSKHRKYSSSGNRRKHVQLPQIKPQSKAKARERRKREKPDLHIVSCINTRKKKKKTTGESISE